MLATRRTALPLATSASTKTEMPTDAATTSRSGAVTGGPGVVEAPRQEPQHQHEQHRGEGLDRELGQCQVGGSLDDVEACHREADRAQHQRRRDPPAHDRGADRGDHDHERDRDVRPRCRSDPARCRATRAQGRAVPVPRRRGSPSGRRAANRSGTIAVVRRANQRRAGDDRPERRGRRRAPRRSTRRIVAATARSAGTGRPAPGR